MDGIICLYLIGIALQCLHFTEECHPLLCPRAGIPGIRRLVREFFVIFNLSWIALWLLAAVGIKCGMRAAFFPVWFFAIGMVGNAIGHPLLSLATGGYFPGLFTPPFAGIIGVILLSRLWRLTNPGLGPIRAKFPAD